MSREIRHLSNALNLLIEGALRADDSHASLADALVVCVNVLHDYAGNLEGTIYEDVLDTLTECVETLRSAPSEDKDEEEE